MMWALLLITLTLLFKQAASELTPPYFNLAEGRKIHATATCGVDTDGPELYCKLVGANTENEQFNTNYEVIQGQVGFFSENHIKNSIMSTKVIAKVC